MFPLPVSPRGSDLIKSLPTWPSAFESKWTIWHNICSCLPVCQDHSSMNNSKKDPRNSSLCCSFSRELWVIITFGESLFPCNWIKMCPCTYHTRDIIYPCSNVWHCRSLAKALWAVKTTCATHISTSCSLPEAFILSLAFLKEQQSHLQCLVYDLFLDSRGQFSSLPPALYFYMCISESPSFLGNPASLGM